MRAFKIVAAALLFAALGAALFPPASSGDLREHILSAEAEIQREHIL
ncbi:hypothetical protein ACIA8G_36940 [Lentzea sp. NPDC051213]